MPATGNEPVKLTQFKSWITGKLSGFLAKPAQDGSAGDVLTLGENGVVVWNAENTGATFKVVDVEISGTQGFNIAPNYSITSDVKLTARIGYVEYPNHIEIKFVRASYTSNPLCLNSKYDASTLKEKMYFANPEATDYYYGYVTFYQPGNKSVTLKTTEVEASSALQGYRSRATFPSVLTPSDLSYNHFIGLVFEK